MAEAIAIPQPVLNKDTLDKAKEIAANKGQERREKFGNNINNFFHTVKEGFNKAVTFVFGAPEAVAYVGHEALTAADIAVNRVMDSAENSLNRFGNRINNGLDRIEERQNIIINNASEKLNQFTDLAVSTSLNTAASVESRIANAVFGIPIWIKETRARIAQNNKDRQEAHLAAIEAKNKAKVDRETKKFQEKMDRLNELHNHQRTNIEASRDAAAQKSQELKSAAKTKREQVEKWGVVRRFIATL